MSVLSYVTLFLMTLWMDCFLVSCIESWVLSLTCLWINGFGAAMIACHSQTWHFSDLLPSTLNTPAGHGVWQHMFCQRKGSDWSGKQRQQHGLYRICDLSPTANFLGTFLFLKWGSRRIRASPSMAVKVMKLRQHMPCSLGGPWAPAVMEAPVATWAFWFSSLPSWEGLDGIAVTRREKCLTNPGWCIFVASSCYQIAEQTCSS